MVEQNKIVINEIPSKTWSWCKMNKAEISFDVQLENFLPEVRGEKNVTYMENGSKLWENLPELTGGAGKGSDAVFEDSLPVGIVSISGKKINEPVVLNYNF